MVFSMRNLTNPEAFFNQHLANLQADPNDNNESWIKICNVLVENPQLIKKKNNNGQYLLATIPEEIPNGCIKAYTELFMRLSAFMDKNLLKHVEGLVSGGFSLISVVRAGLALEEALNLLNTGSESLSFENTKKIIKALETSLNFCPKLLLDWAENMYKNSESSFFEGNQSAIFETAFSHIPDAEFYGRSSVPKIHLIIADAKLKQGDYLSAMVFLKKAAGNTEGMNNNDAPADEQMRFITFMLNSIYEQLLPKGMSQANLDMAHYAKMSKKPSQQVTALPSNFIGELQKNDPQAYQQIMMVEILMTKVFMHPTMVYSLYLDSSVKAEKQVQVIFNQDLEAESIKMEPLFQPAYNYCMGFQYWKLAQFIDSKSAVFKELLTKAQQYFQNAGAFLNAQEKTAEIYEALKPPVETQGIKSAFWEHPRPYPPLPLEDLGTQYLKELQQLEKLEAEGSSAEGSISNKTP